jgi:hypothetical protein
MGIAPPLLHATWSREASLALPCIAMFQCCVLEVSHTQHSLCLVRVLSFPLDPEEDVYFLPSTSCAPFLQSASWSRLPSELAGREQIQWGTSHGPVCPLGLSYPSFPAIVSHSTRSFCGGDSTSVLLPKRCCRHHFQLSNP